VGELTGPDRSWLVYQPRDTIFVRDGRTFDASAQAAAETVRPWPSTVAGALRAAAEAEPAEVVGPFFALQAGAEWCGYLPVPQDVVQTAEAIPYAVRLAMEDVDVASDLDRVDDGRRLNRLKNLVSGDGSLVESIPGLLPADILADYLRGGFPVDGGVRLSDIPLEDPFASELRVGLARQDRRVLDGHLYRARHLRLAEHWGILVGYSSAAEQTLSPRGPVALGGRGRLVDIEPATQFSLPARPDAFPGGRVLVYVATPGIWEGGWLPALPDGAVLVAAVTGEPVAVATTSPRAGWKNTRALRWAVPAGSVYFVQFRDDGAALDWCGSVHGSALPSGADDRLRSAGFGVVLTGVWT
jgi:CRISPR type III-B/RAMP module-associated protein Cmr3